jgi:hypothetical protein
MPNAFGGTLTVAKQLAAKLCILLLLPLPAEARIGREVRVGREEGLAASWVARPWIFR